MTEKTEKQLAAERKAAALRANLKRRKAAARKDKQPPTSTHPTSGSTD